MNERVYNRMKNRKEKIFRWNESALVAYLSGGGGGRYIIHIIYVFYNKINYFLTPMRIQRIHVFLYSSISRKEKYPCSHGNTQKKFRFACGVIPPAFTLCCFFLSFVLVVF